MTKTVCGRTFVYLSIFSILNRWNWTCSSASAPTASNWIMSNPGRTSYFTFKLLIPCTIYAFPLLIFDLLLTFQILIHFILDKVSPSPKLFTTELLLCNKLSFFMQILSNLYINFLLKKLFLPHFDQRLIFNEKWKISVRPNICISNFVVSTHLHKKNHYVHPLSDITKLW